MSSMEAAAVAVDVAVASEVAAAGGGGGGFWAPPLSLPGRCGPRGMIVLFWKQVHLQNVGAAVGVKCVSTGGIDERERQWAVAYRLQPGRPSGRAGIVV